jgi:hypothetical protein
LEAARVDFSISEPPLWRSVVRKLVTLGCQQSIFCMEGPGVFARPRRDLGAAMRLTGISAAFDPAALRRA